jgi:hypothetical protein
MKKAEVYFNGQIIKTVICDRIEYYNDIYVILSSRIDGVFTTVAIIPKEYLILFS